MSALLGGTVGAVLNPWIDVVLLVRNSIMFMARYTGSVTGLIFQTNLD